MEHRKTRMRQVVCILFWRPSVFAIETDLFSLHRCRACCLTLHANWKRLETVPVPSEINTKNLGSKFAIKESTTCSNLFRIVFPKALHCLFKQSNSFSGPVSCFIKTGVSRSQSEKPNKNTTQGDLFIDTRSSENFAALAFKLHPKIFFSVIWLELGETQTLFAFVCRY